VANERLNDAVDKHVAESRREQFKATTAQFLKRNDISEQEKAKTLDQISRLLEAKDGSAEESLRRRAAQEMIYHAAYPDTTGQGNHPTCGPNAVAHELYKESPSLIATMTVDTLLKGSWTGNDGKTIESPQENLIRSTIDGGFPPRDADRTYALQLAESVIMNDIGQHLHPPMKYLEGTPKSLIPGEKVEDTPRNFLLPVHKWLMPDGSERGMEAGSGNFSQSGGLPPWQVAEELHRLTGKEQTVLRARAFQKNDIAPAESDAAKLKDNGFAYFDQASDLENKLAAAKNANQLPMVASVNDKWLKLATDGQPDRIFDPATALSEEDHFAGIDDFTPAKGNQPAKVRVHDPSGSGNEVWISVKALDGAMR
jgi:hypothetical protein